MYKLKTRRSIKKRFKMTSSGKLIMRKASRSHLLEKKSSKRKTRLRKTALVQLRDKKNFKFSLPDFY
uniref:50S ribosomal protein L35 n=1 Tax=Campylaephora sungminbooi TaxID=1896769 RepID=A0A1B0RRP2_9FLOR|nr:ribosomal protein L35 [Campylaephora sungminbooi]AKU47442.1 ribosomal protein L35 [Campylaephora sungminbooi]ALN11889.1 ribosomal protein L35 [Campylaephora sungminbooi]